MEEILINPMSLVEMTIYHTKNVPEIAGVSYGLLYALQQELTYKIALTAPLGVYTNTAKDLVNRMVEYETLRLRKGKDNMNYYEEYILIGWYVMGSEKSIDKKIVSELNKQFQVRGAPYSLYSFVGGEADEDPKVYKSGNLIKYKMQIDPIQKYCVDALSLQSSKKQSVLVKTLKKQKHLLEIYNGKLQKLSQFLNKTKDEEKKRQILQTLQMYDRMEVFSNSQKQKTIQAINYSVLTGLILTYQNAEK